jgi:hypothetical protein
MTESALNFNDAAINQIVGSIMTYALGTNRFDSVNAHEPKSSPGNGISCAIWVQTIRALKASGQASVSGLVVFNARVYKSFVSEPFDMIDPAVMAAISDLIGAMCGDFEFGDDTVDVRMLDVLGANGTPMGAEAGYIEIDRSMYRIMTLTVPLVVNDMWVLSA